MYDVFDLLAAIQERTLEHFYRFGRKPSAVAVSPNSYRRLLEIRVQESHEHCPALQELDSPLGRLGLMIDELLPDTVVETA